MLVNTYVKTSYQVKRDIQDMVYKNKDLQVLKVYQDCQEKQEILEYQVKMAELDHLDLKEMIVVIAHLEDLDLKELLVMKEDQV